MGYGNGLTWAQWLVDDQREASGRPDVLVFTTDILKEPIVVRGEPVVNLVASTSGTDSDWVVKLIDVYPDEVADIPALGGYQLMVSGTFSGGATAKTGRRQNPSPRANPCRIASISPRRTMFSCQATGSWFRFSQAGFLCMTGIRKHSSPIFSGLNPATTAKPFSAFITRPGNQASSSFRSLRKNKLATIGAHERALESQERQ
jgi:hypothetical protein